MRSAKHTLSLARLLSVSALYLLIVVLLFNLPSQKVVAASGNESLAAESNKSLVAPTEESQGSPQEGTPESSSDDGGSLLKTLMALVRRLLERMCSLISSGTSSDETQVANSTDLSEQQRELQRAYEMFMRAYNKSYPPEEIPRRTELFRQRRQLIQDSVRAFSEGRLPFEMRENAFVDWDEHEMKSLLGSLLVVPSEEFDAVTTTTMATTTATMTTTTAITTTTTTTTTTTEPEASTSLPTSQTNATAIVGNSEGKVRVTRSNYHPYLRVAYSADGAQSAPVMVPASKDWRTSGCLAPPIHQHDCGACYAIASLAAVDAKRCLVEGAGALVKFQPTEATALSIQQVVDCTQAFMGYKNQGCAGGWPTRVFEYLQNVQYVARQVCYPFEWVEGACRSAEIDTIPGCTIAASPTNTQLSFKVLHDEDDILYHVAQTGPVTTVLNSPEDFLYYANGVYDNAQCTRDRMDVTHAVLIVGYGYDQQANLDYWLIKNSWGPGWGQGGYGKIRRGSNACSIGHWGWTVLS